MTGPRLAVICLASGAMWVGIGLAVNAAAAQTIPTSPAIVAPGGNITAVANETARSGWPHSVTQAEVEAVTDLAFWRAVKGGRVGESVSVRCFSGVTIARSRCGIVYRTKTTRRAFRVTVKVWEDGAYRITRR